MALNEQEKLEVLENLEIILDKDLLTYNNQINYNRDLNKVEYSTGDMLIKLLSSSSLNKELEEFLLYSIFLKSRKHPRLLFYVGIYYGKIDDLLNSLNVCFFYDSSGVLMIDLFNDYFNHFIHFFSKKQISIFLDLLKRNIYNVHNPSGAFFITSDELKEKIINYQFFELSQTLSGLNIEINRDKEELKQIINYFGFDIKYNEFLTNLDKHFFSETKDSIEIAGMIGTFRQFNSDIIVDIALEVAKMEGLEEIPKIEGKKSTAKIGIAGDYLKEKFGLSNNEEKFLEYFTKILHEEGGHAFLSSIEYFRLTKNITIEIILMLLYKLREFKENNQK